MRGLGAFGQATTSETWVPKVILGVTAVVVVGSLIAGAALKE